MRPQHLFILFVLLSYATAAPFLLPNHQTMNTMGSSFTKSFRGWSNRGLNALDDAMLCDENIQATNGDHSDDSQGMATNRKKM